MTHSIMKWLHHNFTWDHTSGAVGLTAGVLAGILVAIENYLLAELCIAVSGIALLLWAIGLVQHHRALSLLVLVLIVGGSVTPIYLIRDYAISKERKEAQEARYSGYIVPANEPGPELPKGVPADSLQLLLGDDLRVVLGKTDTPVLKYKGQTFLSIALKEGHIKLSTTILDSTNQDMVRIIDNEFQAFPERTFNPKQPDANSLIVRDTKGIEVFSIRCVNDHTIRITGRFHVIGQSRPIIIDAKDELIGPNGGGVAHLTIVDLHSVGVFNLA